MHGADAFEIDGLRVARVPPGLGDRAGLLRVAAREGDVVPAIPEQAPEHGSPGPTADDNSSHDRLTKSIVTGTPCSMYLSRS